MIRYLNTDDVYYSLNDVNSWLVRERILTKEQGQAFGFQCRGYIAKKLAIAYERQCVYQHLEPIVLPLNDYFIHWIVWANLLIMLPGETGKHRKVHNLNLLLGNPETIYLRSETQGGIHLVCLNEQLKLTEY